MQLSVVVPAYKEAHRIRVTVETIATLLKREFLEWEIIVVDDGSDDETEKVLQGSPGVRYLRNERNLGKGHSVRRGMLEARFDPVLFTDADLSTPIEDALPLLEAVNGGSDVAIGSREPHSAQRVRRTPLRKLMAIVFRCFVKTIALRSINDTQCGFKMFRRAAARAVFPLVTIQRWGFDVEVLYLARRLGFKIEAVPVRYTESSESRLRLTTPMAMTADLLRIRWNILLGRYPHSTESP